MQEILSVSKKLASNQGSSNLKRHDAIKQTLKKEVLNDIRCLITSYTFIISCGECRQY